MKHKQICTHFFIILLLLIGIPSALVAQQGRLVEAGGGGGAANYNGNRTITGQLLTGQNLGTTTTVQAFLDAVFFPSQPPTATLTNTINGATNQTNNIELIAAGADLNVTLNYSAGRQADTQPLVSTVVGGVTITPNPNPAANASVSGTRSVTLVRNTNASYTNVVTTTDGKISPNTTSTINWLGRRYYGFLTLATANTPTDAELIGSSNQGLLSILGNVTYSDTPSAGQYMVIAYPASFANLSSITINGFPSLSAFTLVTRSLTNASGFTQSYKIYTSNNPFNTSSNQSIVFN